VIFTFTFYLYIYVLRKVTLLYKRDYQVLEKSIQ
jgi:hypothetical protein